MIKATFVDSMGDDNRVVDAARVSFAKEASNYTEEQNGKLLNYLAKHNHWTPFSHVMITMHEEVPIFVARQRFKHMVGFTYNEVSRRYVDDTPRFYVPDVWHKRADNKKQGSSDETIQEIPVDRTYEGNFGDIEGFEYSYEDILGLCEEWYSLQIEQGGMAPEEARMILPQALMTEYYTTGSLAAFARAYQLRTHEGSQRAIRELAVQWKPIMEKVAPRSTEALLGGVE